MSKKILCSIFIICILICFFLSACCPVESSTALVILAGKHANSVKHIIPIDEELKEIYSKGGNTCIISIDGNPEIIYENDKIVGCFSKEECESISQAYCDNDMFCMENIIEPYVDQVCTFLKEKVAANETEVDTLKAFQQAELAFHALGKHELKRIVIFDSGLCTQGELDFNKFNFLSVDNTELLAIVEKLYEKNEIPDLKDVVVDWYGIGQVYAPQEELSQLQISKLENVWRLIIEKAGGSVNFISFPYKDFYSNVPEVATIQLSEEKIEYIDILFEGGEDVYLNEMEADLQIKELADTIKNNPKSVWAIIGCTAGSTETEIKDLEDAHLSKDRATKVQQHLLKYGVPKRQLKIYAAGPYDPWHIPDCKNGELDDNLAESNRKVRIIDMENSYYQEYANELESYVLR